MARDDASLLARIADCRMAVRADREGTLLRDYHTAKRPIAPGQPPGVFDAKGTVLPRPNAPTSRF